MTLFEKISFQKKILLTVALACLICGSAAVIVAIYFNKVEFSRGLVEKSKTIHGRLDIAATYVANQGGLTNMIDFYTKKYKDSSQLTEQDKKIILQQVPIYAAMMIGATDAEKENYEFRVFSDEPRNEKNAATAAEMEIFKKFLENSSLKEIVSETNDKVVVYRPVRLHENHGCLNCHGDPLTSPWKNGRDILGYKMENWKDGKLHGVFAVSNSIAKVQKAQADSGVVSSSRYLILFILFAAFAALVVAFFAVKAPIQSLKKISDTLKESGDKVNATSGKIAKSSGELAQSTTEQAASLEETAASLEEISAMISKTSDSAVSAANSSSESQKKADDGKTAVERMISSMDQISKSNDAIMDQVNQSNQQMVEIVKVIQEIGEKTKVINDIVFQTKLLSFNASVEAARAGEHGKGFAVVAEEVGNLAQMSGNAAKEISEMLQGSISKVDKIVQDTKTSVERLIAEGKEKVTNGVETAQLCADVLSEIVKNVSNVSLLAQEISSASKEQSQGVGEINKAVAQLDAVTQQNATISDSAAVSAKELSVEASSLNTALEQLVKTIEGNS